MAPLPRRPDHGQAGQSLRHDLWRRRFTNCSNGAALSLSSRQTAPKPNSISFTGRTDGAGPRAGLIMDKKDNLYSTSSWAALIAPALSSNLRRTATKPHSTPLPENMTAPLCQPDHQQEGQSVRHDLCSSSITGCGGHGCGVVFQLIPNGTETVLYSFAWRRQ